MNPTSHDWAAHLTAALPLLNTPLAPGLTPAELDRLETAAGAPLPTEVGLLLTLAVPVGTSGWRNWHEDPGSLLAQWYDDLLDGLLFDVAHKEFWPAAWPARPADPAARERTARAQFARVPRLFPLFGHRGIPLDPAPGHDTADGNPVFSVHQTDVIHYGYDLAGWLHLEFGVPLPAWASERPRTIPFWSDLLTPR